MVLDFVIPRGEQGPTVVSADAKNTSVLGSDGFIYTPPPVAVPPIDGSPEKIAPVDADVFPLGDSADPAKAFKTKKITWANLKAAIAAWYNPLVATVTNKTMSGKTNTFTDIPSSATPDAARLVCLTASGGSAAENGANTWAKVASLECTSSTAAVNLVFGMVGLRHGAGTSTDAAIISVSANIPSASANPTVGIEIIAGGGGRSFSPDAFKLTNDGFGTPVQLWVKKNITFGSVSVYEMARNSSVPPALFDTLEAELGEAVPLDERALIAGWTVTYHNSAPWQSAVPTGTVTNVSTGIGVHVFGQLVSTRAAATAYAMTFGA
jgi:hypothetical protein